LLIFCIIAEVQRYEGASTLYGPHTLAAYQQEFDALVAGLAQNQTSLPGPTPPDLSYVQVRFFFFSPPPPFEYLFSLIHSGALLNAIVYLMVFHLVSASDKLKMMLYLLMSLDPQSLLLSTDLILITTS
jgi:hypothetical protein